MGNVNWQVFVFFAGEMVAFSMSGGLVGTLGSLWKFWVGPPEAGREE